MRLSEYPRYYRLCQGMRQASRGQRPALQKRPLHRLDRWCEWAYI